jgi:hypothetical protein
MSLGTVVIAHYNEDLNWVSQIDKDKYTICTVSKTLPDASIYHPENFGVEASAYLTYIINTYHSLHEYTVFVHGHEYSWHHEGRLQDILNNFTLEHLQGIKFHNFNSRPLIHYVTNNCDGSYEQDTEAERNACKYGMNINRKTIDLGLFKPLAINKYPENFIIPGSAQFWIHKDLILRHSLQTYQGLYQQLKTTPYDMKLKGHIFESMWHVLFTGHYNIFDWIKTKTILPIKLEDGGEV